MRAQLRFLEALYVVTLMAIVVTAHAAETPKPPPQPSPAAAVSSATPAPTPSPAPTPAASLAPVAEKVLEPIEPGQALLFPPTENGIQVPDQELEYSLDRTNLHVGNLSFDADSVNFDIKRNVTSSGETYILKFSWPKTWIEDGTLTVATNLDKKKLYSEVIDAQKVSDFATLKAKDTTVSTSGQGNFEKEISLADISAWDLRTPFKFCIEKTDHDFKKTVCSKDYILLKSTVELRAKGSKDKFKNEANVDGASLPAKGSIPLKYDKKTVVSFTFDTGSVFTTEIQPVKEEITDVVQTEDKKTLVITAKSGLPVAETQPAPDDSWSLKVDLAKPEFYLWTESKIQLKQSLKLPKNIATDKIRPVLKKGTRFSTYSSNTLVHGSESKDWKVSSTEESITARQGELFDWNFLSKDKNQMNTSHIKISKDNEEYSSFYKVYRGYPFEISGRFTAALTGSSALLLGEVLGTAWAENLFKSENRNFSVLRWGVAARYMGTLMGSKDSNGNNTTLSSLNGDIKYRFSPGIWNQDETFGAMLSFQSVNFDSTLANMGGLGLFWVHPMPSSIDKLLNHVRWFRYPKIIDAEVQYYFLPATSGMTLGTNVNAIVHGKLFIKSDFFTEFGIGFRQFGYTQPNVYQAQVSVLFGTGGVGWNF